MADKRDLKIKRLEKWIDDLQSAMYINCVYCGHRYGPDTKTPMRSTLEAHILSCPKHPLSAMKRRAELLDLALDLANLDFNHLRSIPAVGLLPLNNRGRWLGIATGDDPLEHAFRGHKAGTYLLSKDK